MQGFIKRFSETGLEDTAEVGTKAATLGHLYKMRSNTAIPIPTGFILTAAAYRYFLKFNGFEEQLSLLFKNMHTAPDSISETGTACRKLISNGKVPLDLELALTNAYQSYLPYQQDVAIRSSASYSDANPEGLHDNYLNIQGPIAIMYALKCCYASLYTDNAIKYRAKNGIPQTGISMAVIVQKMVRADLASSGRVYTEAFREDKKIKIEGTWGLGHNSENNGFCSDAYHLSKLQNSTSYQPLEKVIGNKMRMLVYNQNAAGTHTTDLKITPAEFRDQFVLNDTETVKLSEWVCVLETILGFQVNIKWAKDGYTNTLFLLSASKS